MGHQVTIVGTSSHIDKIWEYRVRNLTAFLIPLRRSPRILALTQFKDEIEGMKKVLSSLEFDVMHAHWSYEFALAALSVDKNALITAHDAPFTILRSFKDPYRFFRFLMAVRVRARTKNLTFVSPYLKARWWTEMLWRKNSMVIPNISPFQISNTGEFSEMGRVIASIGDSTDRKNIRTLLLAFKLIRSKIPEATLNLFGNDLSENSEIAKWAKQKNLDFGVIWHGYVERSQLEEELGSTDLMIHPSLEDAQPMVLLEAMSQGIPVIGGKDSGGVAWSLGEAGRLVDVKNPEAIAGEAILILTNQRIREQMGSAGRMLIASKYSPEKIAGSYFEEYVKIVGAL